MKFRTLHLVVGLLAVVTAIQVVIVVSLLQSHGDSHRGADPSGGGARPLAEPLGLRILDNAALLSDRLAALIGEAREEIGDSPQPPIKAIDTTRMPAVNPVNPVEPTKQPHEVIVKEEKPLETRATSAPVQSEPFPTATSQDRPAAPRGSVVSVYGDALSSVPHQPPLGDSSPQLLAGAVPTSLVNLRDAALVVLCYNRPESLQRTLESIERARLAGSLTKYISQDGQDPATLSTAKSHPSFSYMTHTRNHNGVFAEDGSGGTRPSGTAFVAAHYKWVLNELFVTTHAHSHVILLEDDMVVTADFVEMFEATAPLLQVDPTLWCISSWNDNGFASFALAQNEFFRTSYFPGLGWMLSRDTWMQIRSRFPLDNWDHWMRVSTTHAGRECVVPFLSRNRNIGEGGTTTSDDFFETYIKPIQVVSDLAPPSPLGDLNYLTNKNYFAKIENIISLASQRGTRHVLKASEMMPLSKAAYEAGHVYIVGFTENTFEVVASQLAIRTSPRATYRSSIHLRYNGADIILVDRKRSPFTPENIRIARHAELRVEAAVSVGISCDDVCATVGDGQYECKADQFSFINDCSVLSSHMQCPDGCTQAWGDEVPCVEGPALLQQRCLESETLPQCGAKHPKTRRLCPCTPKRGHHANPNAPRAASGGAAEAVTAMSTSMSCDDVCAAYKGGPHSPYGAKAWRCSVESFDMVNRCEALQKAFPCSSCHKSRGSDLPNYVVNVDDGQYQRCLTTDEALSCSGGHPHTLRLCPCSPVM